MFLHVHSLICEIQPSAEWPGEAVTVKNTGIGHVLRFIDKHLTPIHHMEHQFNKPLTGTAEPNSPEVDYIVLHKMGQTNKKTLMDDRSARISLVVLT